MNTPSILISDDRDKLQFDIICRFLNDHSYWAKTRSRAMIEESFEGSRWVFGMYDEESGAQIGGARVVSDGCTFGYITDVFIVPDFQGNGLGSRLLAAVMNNPGVARGGRMALLTETPDFYAPFGFSVHGANDPMEFMQRKLPDFL